MTAARGVVASVACPAPAGSRLAVQSDGFDPLGPVVRTARVASGRTVHFIDDGAPSGVPLLFLGGAGTSVRAFRLLEFARTFRGELGIRVISVERNGLGQSTFDPAVGPAEHAADVWSLLDDLGVQSTSIVAISGGGPYAATLAAAHPKRVRSLHVACALAEQDGGAPTFDLDAVCAEPVSWWQFPPSSAVHAIPGFTDSAVEEATRSAFAKGRDVPQEGLRHAFQIYASFAMPSLAELDAPMFLYWGSEDRLVPPAQMNHWCAALGSRGDGQAVVRRLYSGEGHDVQYRHWDQILVDVAFLGERIVASREGRTWLLDAQDAAACEREGWSLGLAAWAAGTP